MRTEYGVYAEKTSVYDKKENVEWTQIHNTIWLLKFINHKLLNLCDYWETKFFDRCKVAIVTV